MEVDMGKDMRKQEKRRVAIRVGGNNMMVWGGVAVLALSFVVASVSSFKSKRKKNNETSRAAEELNKRIEADTPLTDDGAQPLEMIAKMGEDKADHNYEVPIEVKEKNDDEAKNDGATQKYQLSKVLVNTKESEGVEKPIVRVPKKTYAESVKGQGHQFEELVEENKAEQKQIEPLSKKTYAESVRGQGCQFGEIVEESVDEEKPIVAIPEKTYAESVRGRGHQFAEIVEESEAEEATIATVPKETYAESVRGQGHRFGEVIEESEAGEKPIPKKTYAESVMGHEHQFGEVVAKKDTKESEAEEKQTVTAPKITYAESVRGHNQQCGEVSVTKDKELAQKIEMDTPTKLGDENKEDGDGNNGISKDGAEIAEEATYLQPTEKQQECNADGIVPVLEQLIETAPRSNQFAILDISEVKEEELVHEEEEQENEHKFMAKTAPTAPQFANEGKLEVKVEESFQEDEEQKQEEGKVMVEREEESSDINEDDDEEGKEEESEENSEGTADSSIESNVDAVWPAETMDDRLSDIKQREINNQILEETTEGYIEAGRKQKSLKNDNSYATNRCGNSSESLFNFRKRHVKELLLDPSKTRTLIWALLLILLALAAPMVLVPAGRIMKL